MKLLSFLIFSMWCVLSQAQVVVPDLMRNAHYGALVVELGGCDTLLSHNAKQSFVPASLTKLVTTATALQMLTPDFVYKTTLSYSGQINKNTLWGNLLVEGGGDPTLGSKYITNVPMGFIHSWVNHLKKNNIDTITGDLIVNTSIFDDKVLGDKWIWEDVGNYYGAGVYGLAFMDNRYYLTLKSSDVGGPVEVVKVSPKALDINFDCSVVGADNQFDNAYIYGAPRTFDRRVRGTIPAHRAEFTIKGAMPNPPLVFAQVFAQILCDSGIILKGEIKVDNQKEFRALKVLSTWVSPSLSQIIRITNKQSNNLFAEHLLKTLAVGDDPARVNVALDAMLGYWESQGLSREGVRLYDGSGLSRANLLSPEFVVGVLGAMNASSSQSIFASSLAVAGVDGTFKYFLDNTPLKGKVIGKSGGMSGVRCYAGYTLWEGKKYAFCVMVNNSTASMSEIKSAIEEYLLQIWR